MDTVRSVGDCTIIYYYAIHTDNYGMLCDVQNWLQ